MTLDPDQPNSVGRPASDPVPGANQAYVNPTGDDMGTDERPSLVTQIINKGFLAYYSTRGFSEKFAATHGRRAVVAVGVGTATGVVTVLCAGVSLRRWFANR